MALILPGRSQPSLPSATVGMPGGLPLSANLASLTLRVMQIKLRKDLHAFTFNDRTRLQTRPRGNGGLAEQRQVIDVTNQLPHAGWTFFSNHTHVLHCIFLWPDIRIRDIAVKVLITERAVQRIVVDLERGAISSEMRWPTEPLPARTTAPSATPVGAPCGSRPPALGLATRNGRS